MPTATTAGLLSLNNLGGLTTTFTAPASCATAPGFITSGIAAGSFLAASVGNCDDTLKFPKDCFPNGDEASKLWESLDAVERLTVLNYYSPGLHCPNAWSTVGVYAPGHESDDPGTTTVGDRGIFSPSAFTYDDETTSFPYIDFFANMFTSALASTETAVACCPSGFSADPYAGCYSHFPRTSLADKKSCKTSVISGAGVSWEPRGLSWEFWGKTVTDDLVLRVLPTATEALTKVTVTFDEAGWPQDTHGVLGPRPPRGGATDVQGMAVIAPLFLVHDGGDGHGGDDHGKENEDDEDQGNNSDSDSDSKEKDNAAGRLSPSTTWKPILGVLVVWGFSVAAGVGLLIAW